MDKIKLNKFEGPLDLLLQLIEGEKLAITEISLAEVTDQFFEYLNALEGEQSEELADFLVIATKLVYIKSRQLLPYLYPAEEEGPDLAEQLKLYKKYADASLVVEELWKKEAIAYGRMEPPAHVEGFYPPFNAAVTDLHGSILAVLKRLKPLNPLPEVKLDRTISVREKVKNIYDTLLKLRSLNFKDMLDNANSRTEVIVTFLALLELIKQEKASIQQKEAFGELRIEKI